MAKKADLRWWQSGFAKSPSHRFLLFLVFVIPLLCSACAGSATEAGKFAPKAVVTENGDVGSDHRSNRSFDDDAPRLERRDDTKSTTESYDRIFDNPFLPAKKTPLSTFAVNVDAAAYANIRRFLLIQGKLPPRDAVRIEELINYFTYNYPDPNGDDGVAICSETASCPWNRAHRLVRIALQAKCVDPANLPPRHLTFLIDVSGSMDEPNRLPLVKRGLTLLVDQLNERDTVAIVTYAGESGLALPPTLGSHKTEILDALARLRAEGSTNGGGGIQMAYRVARECYEPGAVNRIILATDGDFNVGITSEDALIRLIEEKRESGVFLSIMGMGMGNLKNAMMEKLAYHGRGHYAYIDSLDEARRIFVEEGTALMTVAKDVKVQIEFNAAQVASYRLLGFEGRLLKNRDFKDDDKIGGAMGMGQQVTAFYEIAPGEEVAASRSRQILTVKVRYKEPEADRSRAVEAVVLDHGVQFEQATPDFRFAAAAAEFGLLLRDSEHKGSASFSHATAVAKAARGDDPTGYRAEFLRIIDTASSLARMPEGKQRVVAGAKE